jgi:hypothetical protein
MIEVKLDMEEWQRVLAILAQAPWSSVNQIIMKVGAQMQAQAAPAPGKRPDGAGADPSSASAH